MLRTNPESPGRFHAIARGWGCRLLIFALLLTLPAVGAGEVRKELSRSIETDLIEASHAARRAGDEAHHLQWRLAGFLGAVAGLFVPRRGEGLLTFGDREDDRVEIQVLITAPKREGEYFLYGAEIDGETRTTREVWSSYFFKDRGSAKEQDVEAPDVIDFASAIYYLRWNPPTETTRMAIWSGGKTYAAEVEPLGPETRKIRGKKLEVRGYAVRGVKVKGEPSFKDNMFLYFSRDARAAPVQIVGKRGFVRLVIELAEEPPAG